MFTLSVRVLCMLVHMLIFAFSLCISCVCASWFGLVSVRSVIQGKVHSEAVAYTVQLEERECALVSYIRIVCFIPAVRSEINNSREMR